MKARIILNSNLLSKNAILHDFFFKKSNFKNFRFNFDGGKKISDRNFSKILFYNPQNFEFVMVLDTKNGNYMKI